MKKYITLFLIVIAVTINYGQSVSVSTGLDLLSFPEFTPKFVVYSRSYSISYYHKINDKFMVGGKLRYISSKGNSPYPKGDNPQIHNIDYTEDYIFKYNKFRKGFYSDGRKGKRWGQQCYIVGIQSKYRLIIKNKVFLDFLFGVNLDLYKLNGITLVLHNSELTHPNGEVELIDTYLYNVSSSYYNSVNSGLELGYLITDNIYLSLGTDFIYKFLNYSIEDGLRWAQAANFTLDFSIGYKF